MQQEPNITQPPISIEKLVLPGFAIAFIVWLFVGLPLVYSIGRLNGYNFGYQAGEFAFYYVESEQKYGVYDLSGYLTSRKWIKPYQEGVFDCSEMSAVLESELENEGWHTIMVIGNSPFSSGRHVWLLVETSEGKYMPVESTGMTVVWW